MKSEIFEMFYFFFCEVAPLSGSETFQRNIADRNSCETGKLETVMSADLSDLTVSAFV